ncbi:hypothetical protein BCR35DRAFT_14670 [Leucosporidium creatinivorum]|uniref:Uncharacterized protein n=1 Tax=Leucosporidium creatinivorum TaxID=106004 RepID=A0A1Y2FWQ7_9BASI|nr:hypothetical protein BCR35DRAFT_14670 [Leucosporidium creatinivorum]
MWLRLASRRLARCRPLLLLARKARPLYVARLSRRSRRQQWLYLSTQAPTPPDLLPSSSPTLPSPSPRSTSAKWTSNLNPPGRRLLPFFTRPPIYFNPLLASVFLSPLSPPKRHNANRLPGLTSQRRGPTPSPLSSLLRLLPTSLPPPLASLKSACPSSPTSSPWCTSRPRKSLRRRNAERWKG